MSPIDAAPVLATLMFACTSEDYYALRAEEARRGELRVATVVAIGQGDVLLLEALRGDGSVLRLAVEAGGSVCALAVAPPPSMAWSFE